MSSSKVPIAHATPLIFPPPCTHKTTLIVLHGRGSTAEKFAEPLLSHAVSTTTHSKTSTPKTFREHLSNTKFVFPTAPLRRAVVFKRSLTHQWFDNWSLTEPEVKQHLQVPGLRETTAFLQDLLRDEIKIVGASNVALMGLSQGCAAGIVATLLWEGEPFAALVGMCGYLPFRKGMQDAIEDADMDGRAGMAGSGDEGEEDMFERDSDAGATGTKFETAVDWLCEELQTGTRGTGTTKLSIPVFMGHGTDDKKVPIAFGKMAAEFLKGIDVDVEWREFDGLGHWYSEDMLGEVISFLRAREGWDDSGDSVAN